MGHAETPGNVGRASLAFTLKQIRDQFDVIFEQRGRLRRPRLAEAARLRSFRGELSHCYLVPRRRRPMPRAHAVDLPGRPDHILLVVSKCSLCYNIKPLTQRAAIPIL